MASPEWEAQNAACSPADQIDERDEHDEMLRVLGLLVTLLPNNYREAISERYQGRHPSTFQHDGVVFWRAKKKLIQLGIAYQKAKDTLEECPSRGLIKQLSIVSLMRLQMWMLGSAPSPPAGNPEHPISSDAKWDAFLKCIRAFEDEHRIPILNDLISDFCAIQR